MPDGNPYLGIGLYSMADVARLVNEQPRKLRRWFYGYRHSGQHSLPVFTPDHPELASEGILTFLDLIELKLITLFRRMGVTMPTIRAAARAAAGLYGTRHPFAVLGFRVDAGRRIFADVGMMEDAADPGTERHVVMELPQCQLVMEELAEPFFLKVDYDADMARQYWPLGKGRRVVVDPGRSFGKPIVFPGSVPTHVLHGMVQAGESIETVAWCYRVDEESVRDAIEFEVALAA